MIHVEGHRESRDERVLRAFLNREPLSGNKISTDGQKIDGHWLGGSGIARWEGEHHIEMPDLGSKAADRIQKKLRKLIKEQRVEYLIHEAHTPRVVNDFNTLDDLIAHARDELGATHVSYPEPGTMQGVRIYFPRKDGRYEAANTWQKSGYWHAQGPGNREIMSHLPRGAQSIVGELRTTEARGDTYKTKAAFMLPGKRNWTWITWTNRHANKHAAIVEKAKEIGATQSDFGQAEHHEIDRFPVTHEPRFKLGAPRPGTSVRDYEAVDNHNRHIAGPFKSYSDAKSAAGPGGHVKYVRPGMGEARRGSVKADPRAIAFFRKNAGGVVGREDESARALAHAEQEATARGWYVEWFDDPEGWDSLGDIDPETVKEVLYAVLKDENGEVLASLGSIADPDRTYGRVVEAELALEALSGAGVTEARRRPKAKRSARKKRR